MSPHHWSGLVEHRFWLVNDLTLVGNALGVVFPVVRIQTGIHTIGGESLGMTIHLSEATYCVIPLGELLQE